MNQLHGDARCGLPRVHRPRRGGVGLAREVRGSCPAGPRHRLRRVGLHHRRRAAHLLERHAALRRAGQDRPRRRGGRVLRVHRTSARAPTRSWPTSSPRCSGIRPEDVPRRHRRHRPHAGGPRLLLVAGHAHDRQRRHRGRGEAARQQSWRAAAKKLEVPLEAPRGARPAHLRLRTTRPARWRSTEAVVLGGAGARDAGRRRARTRRRGRVAKWKGAGVGPTPAYSYSACVVELEVDRETGDIRVDTVWIAHDVGPAINPLLVDRPGRGLGLHGPRRGLMEEPAFRTRASTRSRRMLEYKSPTTLETPPRSTTDPGRDATIPKGRSAPRSAGQGPLLPVIPAVANAVYDAVGVRIDEVPITPEKILKALDQKAQGKTPASGRSACRTSSSLEPTRVPPPVGRPRDVPVQSTEAGPAVSVRAGSNGAAPLRARHDAAAALPLLRAADRGGARCALLAEHGRDGDAWSPGAPTSIPNMKRLQMEPRVLVGLRGIRELAGIQGERAGRPRGGRRRDAHARLGASRGRRATTRRSRGRPAWSRRRSSATWGRSAATSASTRAATTTTSRTSGAGRSASA